MTDPQSDPRAAALAARARAVLGRAPAFLVRAPGRVNLLGEHTDYNLLPVLPMAIERCVLIAGARRDDNVVRLVNTGSFPDRAYALERRIAPFDAGDWGNYSKAAAQGLIDHFDRALPRGADMVVAGDISSGAGLSSSSALVVASALALLAANDAEVSPEQLAELLPRAERYVGTLSGGMDQTISLLAQAGHALRIDFAPLRCRPVPLPEHHAVVVCHSMVQAEKSGAAKRGYNRRVRECLLACRALETALRRQLDRPLVALGDLTRLFPHRSLASFVDDLAGVVPEEPVSLDRLARCIGTTAAALRDACGIAEPESEQYTVLRRARHVLTEAERVDRAEQALAAGDAERFGALMDASHDSCRDDYEISCEELEELVGIARAGGAIGSRLTGAGFGGCTVSLVREEETAAFLETVDRRFYRKRAGADRSVADLRFVFTPQPGAQTARL